MLLQVVVFGGGSFGTAMACALARQKGQLNVTLLLRDPYVCKDINERHVNSRYLKVARFHLTCMLAAYPHCQICLGSSPSYAQQLIDFVKAAELMCCMQEYTLPINVVATTSFVEAIQGAQYAIHAVPVQHSRKFLESIAVSISPVLPCTVSSCSSSTWRYADVSVWTSLKSSCVHIVAETC